jgi:DNA-directed RNA polymerase subunit D
VAVGYRHLQRVEVVGDASEFEEQEPNILRGVIETEEGELVPTGEFGHDLTERYPDSDIEVTDVPNAFVFHVESDGSMSAEELVLRAVESIGARADELQQAVTV